MASIALVGFSIYLMFKRNPNQSKSMLGQVSNIIKYMPIDKNASNMFSPLFSNNNDYDESGSVGLLSSYIPSQQKRMLNSGQDNTKRCVSETKKWVASQQGWKCGKCGNQLNAWFEVDHKIRLEYGGSNHVNNLVALCRECHGEKTMMDKL